MSEDGEVEIIEEVLVSSSPAEQKGVSCAHCGYYDSDVALTNCPGCADSCKLDKAY